MAAKTNSTITVKPTTRTAMNTTTTKTLTTTNFTSRSEPITTVAPTTQIFGTTTETLNTTTIDNTTTINNTRSDNKGGMKMSGILGIAAGVCLVIFVLCVVLFILYRKRRKPAKARPTPTLPSASELDGTIYKQSENYSSTINDESAEQQQSADAHPSPLYTNIDGLGKANERTNPSVGDDGYLKKTQTGLDYNGEGKKKKRKKKIKNKFKTNKNNERHKVQEENTEENPHFVNGENVNENTSKTEHTYINRANSDIEYSEGRAAGTVQRGYPNVNKSQTNTFYENTTEIGLREARNVKGNDTDAMVANYYNVNEKDEGPSEIYENTG